MRSRLLAVALMVIMPLAAQAASLRPGDAASHVGETETVCGMVASVHFAFRSRGQPTFLNLGRAYPNQEFTAVIWGEDRPKFGKPESLAGHNVCVTGPITLYRGRPEVILQSTAQLQRSS